MPGTASNRSSSSIRNEDHLNFATIINKVQITLRKNNTLSPILIDCSGVRRFQPIPAHAVNIAVPIVTLLR